MHIILLSHILMESQGITLPPHMAMQSTCREEKKGNTDREIPLRVTLRTGQVRRKREEKEQTDDLANSKVFQTYPILALIRIKVLLCEKRRVKQVLLVLFFCEIKRRKKKEEKSTRLDHAAVGGEAAERTVAHEHAAHHLARLAVHNHARLEHLGVVLLL
jgi:hypothetical protein